MNAVMHRDYEANTPIHFYEYDERIELQNPDSLYGRARPENFPEVNDYRNPLIAEAMRVMGYVNRFSRGVMRVREELETNGNGVPAFKLDLLTAFEVNVNWAGNNVPKDVPNNGDILQKSQKKNENDVPNNVPKKASDKPLSDRDKDILGFILQKNDITIKEIAIKLNVSQKTVKRHIESLKNQNLVSRSGTSRKGFWIVRSNIPEG